MPYFIFKNKNSRDYNIHINLMPPIQTVDEEISYIEVPGRNGFLSISTNRKPTLEKEFVITIYPDTYMIDIKRWLKGSGKLIISNDPDIFYKATIQTIRNLWGVNREDGVSLNFICQPEAYLHTGENLMTITEKDTKINNPEDVSYPLIKIYGSGPVDLLLNDKIHKFNIDEYVTVDSQLMESYKDNSLVVFTGDFPTLIPGENNISWDGTVTKIEVIPRWQR